MLLLDCEKGVTRKTIKQGCFCHSLLERRKREKGRERAEVKKHHHFYTKNVGAFKTGRKLFHLFGPQKFNF